MEQLLWLVGFFVSLCGAALVQISSLRRQAAAGQRAIDEVNRSARAVTAAAQDEAARLLEDAQKEAETAQQKRREQGKNELAHRQATLKQTAEQLVIELCKYLIAGIV